MYDRIRETALQVSLLKDEYQLAVERREYETVAAAKSAYYRHKHLLNEADVSQRQTYVCSRASARSYMSGLQRFESGAPTRGGGGGHSEGVGYQRITDVGLQLPSETSYRAH